MMITEPIETVQFKSILPFGGPRTNAPFEELRQNPRSEYSLSMVYLVALMATAEQQERGDRIFYSDADVENLHWTIYRDVKPKGRIIIVQLKQVTTGGSIQFRVLDVARRQGWKSTYIPTAALMRGCAK